MISHHLVTCSLCQSYYADPRQIPCSHSFCFDCICGRFDNETMNLICPKCCKIHQYHSREEFETRCIRDAFLASMVSQFKKKQSRLTATFSRPTTPLIFDQIRSPAVLSQPTTRSFIAKCQSCNQRCELTVCSHCENVICPKCLKTHQNLFNNEMKRIWETCQMKFETIFQRSECFDLDHQECEYKGRQIQRMIHERGDKSIETIEQQKKFFFELIEKHRRYEKSLEIYEEILKEFEMIDRNVFEANRSNDFSVEKLNEFLQKISQIENRLENLAEHFDSNDLKFPILTLPSTVNISSFFGVVDFVPFNRYSPNDFKSIDEYVQMPFDPSNRIISIPNHSSLISSAKKKFLWQIDFKSVPHFIRMYHQRLFVCDKYGYLAVYQFEQLDDFRSKPKFLHENKLFSNLVDDSSLIESFVVLPYGILILKQRSTDEHCRMIYLFTHDGFFISNHPYSFRELTFDLATNTIWSLDEDQSSLFFSSLPDQRTVSHSMNDYFPHLSLYLQFNGRFRPTNISLSDEFVGLFDKNHQTIEIFDKRTREKVRQFENVQHETSHICWDVALMSDETLVVRLDEINTLKLGPSKHIFLHLDVGHHGDVLAIIDEFDAYGMTISPTNEIFLGLRTKNSGVIKCFA